MQIELQQKIKKNPLLFEYLHENSYWYKYLHRGEEAFPFLEKEMKERYKLRIQDRVEHLASTLQMVRSFMDVLK